MVRAYMAHVWDHGGTTLGVSPQAPSAVSETSPLIGLELGQLTYKFADLWLPEQVSTIAPDF